MEELAVFSRERCAKIYSEPTYGLTGAELYPLVAGGCTDTCAPKGEACGVNLFSESMVYKILN
jgi:hypothetical protein